VKEAKRMVALLAALAGLCALAAVTTRAEAAAVPTLEIKVLSNRADLISGGDALVEVAATTRSTPISGATPCGSGSWRPTGTPTTT